MARPSITVAIGPTIWAKAPKRTCPICTRIVAFTREAYVPHHILAPHESYTKGPCPVNKLLGLTHKPRRRAPVRPLPAIPHYDLPSRPPARQKLAPRPDEVADVAKASRLDLLRRLGAKKS